MPINIFGDLKIVATDELGGLGSRVGPPVAVAWSPLNALGPITPFLLLLALMFLKPNRRASAWWVWLPLLVTAGALTTVASADWPMPAEIISVLLQVFTAVVMGLSVLWLLAPYLAGQPRGLVFLSLLLGIGLLGTFDVATALVKGDFELAIPSLILVAMAAAHASVAFLLASLHCRRQFGRAKFLLWLFVWTLAITSLVAVPFGLLGGLTSGRLEIFYQIALGISCLGLVSFLVQQPFYLLAFVQPFYRERIVGLVGPRITDSKPGI